ncbi:PIN domain-containing protein [Bosea sp. (in: a-proteobacteria)]|uniref:PIN domain-containing protein n=1 Tax=Bosea sp. (in: a-proteobacteria) TaxID=1871050 RepID=UPI0027376ED4|nr:PIN domain-containing protein [Bosea sp. (in: a-proteobacteria)]MDP3254515.1 PIN domain-containing protein [Bosea sp. (in: a-proteobacteria)]
MTAPHEFLDTNVLIYAVSDDPRSARAEALLAKGCASSVQALNEFANVARRKLAMEWREVQEALDAIRSLLSAVAPLGLETHRAGLELAERHRLSVYDAMMIAAALHLRCTTFWSEDLQDGLVVEERLTVRNPFLEGSR